MILYYHPLSSYCWKVLIAFYENGAPFAARTLEEADVAQEWMTLWPIGKFPLLRDPARDATIGEASIIIEYLAQHEHDVIAGAPATGHVHEISGRLVAPR
ncbi:hypothetical protein sphantq_01831 [Sphingobium sp. AntQ-1]|nr:hypothetical protein sphantq_01831 [Sphingobium sp. AntQ-1]